MKKILKTALMLFAAAVFAFLLASCMRNSVNNTQTGITDPPSSATVYHTVKFISGVDEINLRDATVADGKKVSEPIILTYREGYRLVGWRISGTGGRYSFDSQVTSDLTLIAVWEAEAPGHIYDSMTPVAVIHDGTSGAYSLAEEIAERAAQSNYIGIEFYSHTDAQDARYHEIVVGNTERDISKAAYSALEKLVGDTENAVAYLLYSDGSSLALAYTETEDELALRLLHDILIENYIGDELNLSAGVHESYLKTTDEYYLELDEKNRAEDWKELEEHLTEEIGAEGATAFVEALKDLYSLYTSDVIEWFANLYDPSVGGYYYSNSARDNEQVLYNGTYYDLLPDIESTSQALNFIVSSGMAKKYADALPSFMKEQIVSFILGTQDENGYFYHPQWPKEMTDSKTSRRSRDLTKGLGVLSAFGVQPLYTTPTGVIGSTATASACLTLPISHSAVSAVSLVIQAATVTNTNLQDKESFTAYLDSLDIANRSYHVGNELTSQSEEILARDKQLAEEGADYQLMDILIEWLNENQNPETGHWHHTDNYYGVNGLLKISGIYNDAKVAMPHAKEAAQSAIRAITSDEAMGAVVDLYNTWFSISNIVKNIRKYGTEADNDYADEMIRELCLSAPAAILKSKEKISVFQKADGSFSYNPNNSSSTSQGMPVAIYGTNEGDVNATVISITGIIGNLLQALELESYKPMLFGKTELRRYISILEENNAELAKKLPLDLSEYGKLDFTDGEIPDRITATLNSEGASATVTDGALVFTTSSGANDSLYITAEGTDGNAVIFNADITLSGISGSNTLFQMLFSDSASTTAYMPVIGYESGYITISDASSTGDADTRRVQLMKSNIAVGESFNLGIEYYILDDDSIRVKIFIDGSLIYVSDNYYNSHKADTPSTTAIEKMRFYSLNAASVTMTVDNIIFVRDNADYVDLALGAK